MKGNYTIILLMFGKFLVECPLTFGGSHIGLLLHGAGGHPISLPLRLWGSEIRWMTVMIPSSYLFNSSEEEFN